MTGRYWVFAGDHHYPHKGLESLVYASNDKAKATTFARKMKETVTALADGVMVCDSRYSDGMPEWWQVVDTNTLIIVAAKGFDDD